MAQNKYYFANPDSYFKEFPEETLEAIIEDYKNEELPLYEVYDKHPQVKTGEIHEHIPFVLTDEPCEICGEPIYKRHKRERRYHYTLKLCRNCGHDYTDNCACEACVAERKVRTQKLNEFTTEAWEKFYKKHYNLNYTLDDLTIFEEIHLILAIESLCDTRFNSLVVRSNDPYLISSKEEIEGKGEFINYVEDFIRRKLLIPSTKYFKRYYGDNRRLIRPSIDTYDVHWIPNIKDENGELYGLTDIRTALLEKEYSRQEKLLLWRDVYYSELFEYTNFQFDRHIRASLSETVLNQLTDKLIVTFPLSQAYALVGTSISSTMKYQNNYKADPRKINSFFRNKMIENMKRFGTKHTHHYNRPSEVDMSDYKYHIINHILGQFDTYFNLATDRLIPEEA